jgi:hypothetical protein
VIMRGLVILALIAIVVAIIWARRSRNPNDR